jgi:hypothetical protein
MLPIHLLVILNVTSGQQLRGITAQIKIILISLYKGQLELEEKTEASVLTCRYYYCNQIIATEMALKLGEFRIKVCVF